MNCEVTRQRLADAFDGGAPPPPDALAHAAVCPDCGAYRAALAALEADLRDISVPAADPALAARVRGAVTEERRARRESVLVRGGLAAAAVLAAAAAGWRYPLPWDARAWWQQADASWDPAAWQALGTEMLAPFHDLWSAAGAWAARGTDLLSPLLLWGGVGAAALVLVLYNAFEAHSLGGARQNGPRRGRG